MQIDRSPFSVNKLDLKNPVVLIQPEQADTIKGKNVVVGNPRPKNDAGPTPSRKVVIEKLPDGEETITITSGAPRRTATRGRPNDQLRLTTTESGSRLPLTRSRWSDRHPVGQIATIDPSKRHSVMIRPLVGPIRPSSCRTELFG
jgi:hypothetical protein